MLTEYLLPLTAALILVAATCVLSAVVVWKRASAAHAGMERLATSMDERAITLPEAITSSRATLAERSAAAEHAQWKMARLDGQLERATTTLAQRRQSLDALRARLEGARVNVERLKSAARLIMKAIELRRAILG